ncbi:uncharacterized protein LOC120078398 [Benincasa hispida]|uniref:uncharacterized protein LOC120078398 n=1 Tax=Benincasa hispida TaxID=102211 RepID=UPI0018FFD4CB|nr:uncharacterized protein LOC120078398 [Benincasa hispida]
MASNNLIFFLLPSLALLQPILAVEYTVTNNARGTLGGTRFDNIIGANYSRQTLVAATTLIWNIFKQSTAADRKYVQKISLFIDKNFEGVALTTNDEIHLGANYISSYSGDLKREITGVLYHEMTNIWQWGNSEAPGGLIEGIADYVRLKSGYIPGHWVEPGGGNWWDEGYDVTARFLDYLEGVRSGLVAELNRRLRNGYSADYFRQFLGKPVDELWAEYKTKAKYGKLDKKCDSFEIEVNGVFALQL